MVVTVSVVSVCAETAIRLPKNKHTPEQDVELGQQTAAEVRQREPQR